MSCKSLLIDNPTGKSGVWWLDADGPFGLQAPYPVWCDMMAEGGGWTMLLKVGAENSQLGYDAPAWSNIIPLHPDRPRLDAQEAKLDSYWSLPFTELRVGLSAGKQTAWLVMPVTAASLHQIIVQGTYLPSNISLTKWLGLLPGSVLQPSCNLQGFNVAPGKPGKYDFARVRIGVVANLEGNCDSPDSRLGIGGAGTTCAQSGGISSGNAAGCLGSGAAVNLPAVGYVFAR